MLYNWFLSALCTQYRTETVNMRTNVRYDHLTSFNEITQTYFSQHG